MKGYDTGFKKGYSYYQVADISDKLKHNEKIYESLSKSQILVEEKLQQLQELYEEGVKEEGTEKQQTEDVLKYISKK